MEIIGSRKRYIVGNILLLIICSNAGDVDFRIDVLQNTTLDD